MTDAFVGIDVSESGLALAVHQSDHRFECPLDPSTPHKLINQLKTLQPKLIVLSATHGGAAIRLAAALHAAGFQTVAVDERSLRKFAQKESENGHRADLLARYAAGIRQGPTSRVGRANEIDALLLRRAELVAMLDAERARQQSSESTTSNDIAAHVFEIEKRIAGIDFQLKQHLREAGVWRVKSELSQSLPAVALVSVAIAAAVVLLLLPLWIVKYPPLLDYPNHLARVFILTHINDPNYQFSEYYTATIGPYPYLTMDVLLMGLQKFTSIVTGGRIILSLCVGCVVFCPASQP
jgi:hypothetical protein